MKFFLYGFVIIGLIGCQDDEPIQPSDKVVISSSLYETAAEEYGSIINASISGDILTIEFGASGCSGESWVWNLYDAGVVMESHPIQRNIKFSLTNPEACQAYFTREVSFDISAIRVPGNPRIIINLANYDGELFYDY